MDKLSRTVCVTGATGYLGSWLVMKLLNHGYSVNATLRSDKDISYLTSLPGASERLKIFKADLNQPDSFKPAIRGCSGVFLVAHPMNNSIFQTQETITRNNINSTLAILQACIDAKTVKRVLYTSTSATVMYGKENSNRALVDENSWSDVNFVRRSIPSMATYIITKTLTERAAIEFAEKHALELVTVLPSWIHGPFIGPSCPRSVCSLMTMFYGNRDVYNYTSITEIVHVDDLANAHIFLFEHPDAKGRYICSNVEASPLEFSEFLRSRYREYQLPALGSSVEIEWTKSYKLSSKRLLETGFEYKYGLKEIYDGAVECCKRIQVL